MDGIMFALLITFTICFIIGFGGYYFEAQNQKILEETKRSIERTNDLSMTYINDYYESNKLRMDEIEKTFLAEMACLATKNNNDIKEIKDKITTFEKVRGKYKMYDEQNIGTTQTSETKSITMNPPKMIGWICPVCGRGLSPYTTICPCKGWIEGKLEVTC